MKKLIPTLVLCLVFAQSYGQADRDKVLHFVGGGLFGLAGAGIAKHMSDGNRYWTFAGAVGGSLLVGLGKEAIDAGQRENGWDNEDLLATVLGGVTVGLTIDLFTNHNRNKKRKGSLTVRRLPESFKLLGPVTNDLKFAVTDNGLPSINYLSLPESIR